jgi:hypothetical protein
MSKLNGLAKKTHTKSKDVNKKQLKMGTKVEMEHTDDLSTARDIALDHLAEIEDYYTRLEKMEKSAPHLKHPQIKAK